MLNHCLNSIGGGIFGLFGMIIWIGLIIFAIWFVAQWFVKKNNANQYSYNTQNAIERDTLTLLNERFIQGEINEEEYIRKRQLLQK